ncbi:interleukin-17 receptor E-like protein isoform X2 [Lepisosteus oculatus]|uniref:interleukin-17 receptor E-like protein isoform X2 n=1 Tax=Lepisosteus oculatus TaxID=7918 RepID=UPI0037235FC7
MCLSINHEVIHIFSTKGLHCKSKAHSSVSFCKRLPKVITEPVFQSVNISTVMKCEKRQMCSLHLKIMGILRFDENIRGVKMCSMSLGTSNEQCHIISFKATDRKLIGQEVHVQYNCFDVVIGEQVDVTLKTIPYYCDLRLSQSYHVQDCTNKDVRHNIPQCIAGKLDYTVEVERKLLSVQVTELLDYKDYHLRLCHKWYSCQSTGSYALIKRENPMKNATLPYSRLYPCLCIEGWSSMEDASRIQLCPFKNNTEELWSGITYNSAAQELSWKPVCPIDAKINLCWTSRENLCLDLANTSQDVHGSTVKYAQVDPNPSLCMKFTTEAGSWIKCPFSKDYFPAWDMKVISTHGQQQIVITSQISTVVSLSLCKKGESFLCDPEEDYLISILLDKSNTTIVNLTNEVCKPNVCIQARRLDAKYSAPVQKCKLQCSQVIHGKGQICNKTNVWMMALSLVILTAFIVAAIIGSVMLKGLSMTKQPPTMNKLHCSLQPKEDSDLISPLSTCYDKKPAHSFHADSELRTFC